MGNEPAKKQRGIGFLRISGINKVGTVMKIIPDMVKGHDHDHQSFEKVKGFDPRLGWGVHDEMQL